MNEDPHDKMIAEFQSYFDNITKFEVDDNVTAGKRARQSLLIIKKCAITIRDSITARTNEIKSTRIKKNGRPRYDERVR